MTTSSNHSHRLLTRRRSLQLLAAGGLAALLPNGLWVAGCGGAGVSLNQVGALNLSPPRVVIPIGGRGKIIAARLDGHEVIIEPAIASHLPGDVTIAGTGTIAHLKAGSGAIIGRHLATLGARISALTSATQYDPALTALFEIIVIPSDHGVGLTIGPHPRFGGPASPGGQTFFAVTATATQTVDSFNSYPSQTGFTGAVRLRVEGLPAGVTGGFTPTTLRLTPGEEKVTSLTISVGTGVPHGRYPFTVLADHDGPPVSAANSSSARGQPPPVWSSPMLQHPWIREPWIVKRHST